MKKLLSFILLSLLIIVGFIPGFDLHKIACAENLSSSLNNTYINQILVEFSEKFTNRQAGTDGEVQAANYIKEKLDQISLENSNFNPLNSTSTNNGVQEFLFKSKFTGQNAKSQNLIYSYKTSEQTDKKVILACNYDNIAFKLADMEYQIVESQGVNSSAGSVAVLLSISNSLSQLNLPYNVDIVFFGAGESYNAGSNFYTTGILHEEKENILCMINIDNIALGQNLYFYVNEYSTNFEEFISNSLRKNKQKIEKINTVNLGKVLLDYENELGLTYNHIAMNSDHINFMKNGITTINLFAGDYNEGIIYGRSEYLNQDVLTYTKDDNLDVINEKYGISVVENNLKDVNNAIILLLQDENFVNECISAQNSTKCFYSIFGNQKFIAYISAVVLIVIIGLVSYLKMRYSILSCKSNLEPEFLSTVISISQNIDSECKDENVPKSVSQLVAHDIKKDKVIKVKKKK